MKINQEKVDEICLYIGRYLPWLLKDYEICGEENIEKLEGKKVLYLPNHLSHMDYILLPFIFNKNKLSPPAIVAGSNLKLFFSKDTGALFVNRKVFKKGPKEKKIREIIKLRKNVEEVVKDENDLMVFIEGGRSYNGEIMKCPKEKYPKEYFTQILNQNKNPEEYFGINIAINYKPQTIEKPFLKATKFFKDKINLFYYLSDASAFLTQPIRKKPTAYVNFGEPYPLKEFIEKRDSKGLVNFAKEDIKKLYEEIN